MRGRGLKLNDPVMLAQVKPTSPAMRGRGLKPPGLQSIGFAAESPAMRGRGLKLQIEQVA